ncbi:hypothetical protein PPROV_000191800 [Pycnococcus provasolii]|uniref:4a-hydroxytetrahydrobiopterin dehydratase n=1 Tax=Pycnococcus provasolii TaxID=41880 RepID=A0A830H9Q4_9CHLO|nr:hypothetical protein PPROV_000191800 [Pycnococcus provasolii]
MAPIPLSQMLRTHATAYAPRSALPHPRSHARSSQGRSSRHVVRAGDGGNIDMNIGGDIGARDPYAAEVESNFASNVLGNADTEHIVKPPEKINEIVGLAIRKCVPCEAGAEPLELTEANKMARQAGVGWAVTEDAEGKLRVRQKYKLRNFEAGLEMMRRVGEIAEAENHHPDLHLEQWNELTVEIFTHKIGGLHENDFILAAKIEKIDISDLLPKKKQKFWA